MIKVLLILDDYNEMTYLQSFLRKLGIDVEGLPNTKKLEETVLGFFPKIILATLNGKVVDGVQIAKSLSRRNGIPRICLLRSASDNFTMEQAGQIGVDELLDSPVNIRKLIEVIARLGELDQKLLLEKFAKIQARAKGEQSVSEPMDEIPLVAPADPMSSADRRDHYRDYLKNIDKSPIAAFPRDSIRQHNKEIRKTPLPEDAGEVEAERFQFIKALFHKAKG